MPCSSFLWARQPGTQYRLHRRSTGEAYLQSYGVSALELPNPKTTPYTRLLEGIGYQIHKNKFWNTQLLLSNFWCIYVYFFLLWLKKNFIWYIDIEFQICPNLIPICRFLAWKERIFLVNQRRTDPVTQSSNWIFQSLSFITRKDTHSEWLMLRHSWMDIIFIIKCIYLLVRKQRLMYIYNRMEMKSVYKIMRPMFRRRKAMRRFSGRPIWWKVKPLFQACQNVNERSSRMNYHVGKGT